MCWIIEGRNSLPFKGRVREGMGRSGTDPTPILTFPLKGKELILRAACVYQWPILKASLPR